jgi:ribosomal protein S18 acetylase RimI-like enzyme
VTFESVAENLRESFRVVAASRGKGEIRELHGVSIASAGVEFQMFNAAFLSAPVASEAELAQRILLASLHFDSRGQSWAWWVCEDMLEPRTRRASRRIFERHGLRHSVDMPGMLAETVAPPVKPLPEMEIRRVHDGATRDTFCAITSVCFHAPVQWFLEVFDNVAVWERFAAYVGYIDSEPVSTTAIVMGGNAAGVYNVATMPQHRHHGYGEAIMRYGLERAYEEHGTERSILQATPAGARLYERMGYRTVAKIAVYASARRA